jgi:hypothetical protein
MTGEYNIQRAFATLNKRFEPLLVVFKQEVRNGLLVKNPEDRPFFTKDQCELINGQPFDEGDQDKAINYLVDAPYSKIHELSIDYRSVPDVVETIDKYMAGWEIELTISDKDIKGLTLKEYEQTIRY